MNSEGSHYVSINFVHNLLEALPRLGIDKNEFFKLSNFDTTLLGSPENIIQAEELADLWLLTESLSNVNSLALELAESSHPSSMAAFGTLINNCSTIKNALDVYCNLVKIFSNTISVNITSDASSTLINIKVLAKPYKAAYRIINELMVLCTVSTIRDLSNHATSPRSVKLTTRSKNKDPRIKNLLDCEITYSHHMNVIEYKASELEKPILFSDRKVFNFILQLLNERAKKLHQGNYTSIKVYSIITSNLVGKPFNSEAVAHRLNMSVRKMQKDLEQEGTTYGEILIRAKADIAKHYLSHTSIPIKKIAQLTSYSTSSSFARAFYEWTSLSPNEFRQKKISSESVI